VDLGDDDDFLVLNDVVLEDGGDFDGGNGDDAASVGFLFLFDEDADFDGF
jgi:hypothetical protein